MKILKEKQKLQFVKKIGVMILVLTMAAAAKAELLFTLSGPSSLNFGQTGTYIIGYSGLEISGADIDIVVDKGELGGGVILVPHDSPPDIWIPPLSGPGNFEMWAINDSPPRDLGSPLFSFDFTAPSSGTIGEIATISLLENSFLDLNFDNVEGAIMPYMQITLTPEPTTLVLLGLGGLLLRRCRN